MELVGWTFLLIIAFCLYVLIGLYITENIIQSATLILTWVIYTCLCFTLVNIIALSYFWATVRNKQGPVGIRGISGEKGDQGISGS